VEAYAMQHPENISSHIYTIREVKSDVNYGYETEILFRNSIVHIYGYHPNPILSTYTPCLLVTCL
jgi:hypothetical protein